MTRDEAIAEAVRVRRTIPVGHLSDEELFGIALDVVRHLLPDDFGPTGDE